MKLSTLLAKAGSFAIHKYGQQLQVIFAHTMALEVRFFSGQVSTALLNLHSHNTEPGDTSKHKLQGAYKIVCLELHHLYRTYL